MSIRISIIVLSFLSPIGSTTEGRCLENSCLTCSVRLRLRLHWAERRHGKWEDFRMEGDRKWKRERDVGGTWELHGRDMGEGMGEGHGSGAWDLSHMGLITYRSHTYYIWERDLSLTCSAFRRPWPELRTEVHDLIITWHSGVQSSTARLEIHTIFLLFTFNPEDFDFGIRQSYHLPAYYLIPVRQSHSRYNHLATPEEPIRWYYQSTGLLPHRLPSHSD